MRSKPCYGCECDEWCESNGYDGPTAEACYTCGFEGPMLDWYAERDSEREELGIADDDDDE